MFRRVLGVGGLGAALAAALILGADHRVPAAPGSQQLQYNCSIKVPEPEPADLTALARISAAQAMAAALAAYPGARVKALALDNENGCLVYSVVLSNGLEVKVDAGDGRILRAAWEDEEEHQEPRLQSPQRRPRK